MLTWLEDKNLVIDGTRFEIGFGESNSTRFILAKGRHMVEKYRELFEHTEVNYMVDLGVYQGGSCVLFEKLEKLHKLIAVEIEIEDVRDFVFVSHTITLKEGTKYGETEKKGVEACARRD